MLAGVPVPQPETCAGAKGNKPSMPGPYQFLKLPQKNKRSRKHKHWYPRESQESQENSVLWILKFKPSIKDLQTSHIDTLLTCMNYSCVYPQAETGRGRLPHSRALAGVSGTLHVHPAGRDNWRPTITADHSSVIHIPER
ncbi:RPA-related protein RADX [Manis javanica]|nr:RPA-related protein RADX [Manis javanica]